MVPFNSSYRPGCPSAQDRYSSTVIRAFGKAVMAGSYLILRPDGKSPTPRNSCQRGKGRIALIRRRGARALPPPAIERMADIRPDEGLVVALHDAVWARAARIEMCLLWR